MDNLYALWDHCAHEDILQQIRKNIKATLNLVEVNNKISSKFNRISNKPANKALFSQNHSSHLKNIIKLHQQKTEKE